MKTKSRLVAKGFSQVAGFDYNETTSPTPAAAPVKMIAAVAYEKGLPVYHLDVSQAFVQAPLKEEIFMRLPPGCGELSGKIVRLQKCQYGHKQAGSEWHMTGLFLHLNFRPLRSSPIYEQVNRDVPLTRK